MFTESSETQMTILDDGRVNITIITHYFKDGVEIGQDNWGCCLEPHPAYLEYAETFLDERQMNAVRALWTDEVMEAFAEKQYRNRKE